MNGNKKVILHLVFDGVLFDQVFLRFENMEKYENRYLFDVLGCNQKLEFIKMDNGYQSRNVSEYENFFTYFFLLIILKIT